MIDINGRNPFAKFTYREVNRKLDNNFGMGLGGRVKELHDFKWLDMQQGYNVSLYPQRTVVQFNSTYMELTGRQDRIRGDVTAWGFFFLIIASGGVFSSFSTLIMDLGKGNSIIFMSIIAFVFTLMSVFLLVLLSTELFTYTYLPIRFNRKTRKVYVRQANRKVEVFDWDELKFYMATTYKDGGDVRGLILADDGVTITSMFSLPFVNSLGADKHDEGALLGHFELVRRYMEGDDKQLIEVEKAIRYIHPVHEKRETPLVSLQRVKLGYHASHVNQEYPNTFKPVLAEYLLIPFAWLRYLGRLLSINTSITPKFSPEIEAECQIDPNDPHDLNKYLPEGNLEDSNQPLWKKLAYSIGLILFGIVMLFAFAFFVDIIGSIRGHYPDVVGKLWYVVSLGWL